MGWINQRDSRNSRAWDGSTREIAGTVGHGMNNQRDSRNSRAWDGSNREIAGTAGCAINQPER